MIKTFIINIIRVCCYIAIPIGTWFAIELFLLARYGISDPETLSIVQGWGVITGVFFILPIVILFLLKPTTTNIPQIEASEKRNIRQLVLISIFIVIGIACFFAVGIFIGGVA